MKIKLTAFLFGILILNVSCLNDDYISPQEQLDRDIKAIDEYLKENSINAASHESGIRYQIHNSGDGEKPEDSDKITINYEGRFLTNEKVFDQADSIQFQLNTLIVGWRIGVPLIREGGSITLYIPSGYAYGPGAQRSIPANSNLIFDIDLIKVGD